MKKHSLLFIFTDEQRADTMAAYGNELIDVPNLNRFAKECQVFDKCYVTQPVCTPSRSTLMTGLCPHTNGCTQNNVPLRPDTPCLPEMVSGYRTAYFGKWHLGDEVFAQHGFDHWVSVEDMYIPHYREGRDRNTRSTYHHWLVKQGYAPDLQRDQGPGVFSRPAAARLPEEHCKPAYLADETCEWLRALGSSDPFAACVNFLEPHMPFTGPRDGQYDPGDIPLPGNFDHPPAAGSHLRNRMLHAGYRSEGYGGVSLDTEDGWRRIRANYWGLVSQVDAAVGRILDAVAACGRADDTIVVFTSDHGDMMGSHQLLAKTVMYEEAVTVPLLIHAPGLTPGRISAPVSQLDLVPTLLDLMNEPIPSGLQGQSLRAAMEGGRYEPRDVVIEWDGTETGVSGIEGTAEFPDYLASLAPPDQLERALRDPLRTIITPDCWKLVYSPDLGQHALYDLNADPLELHDLCRDPEHQSRIKDMTRRLAAWGQRTGDPIAANAQ